MLKLIGSDFTAFGLYRFFSHEYFGIRASNVIGWTSTPVLRPGTLSLRRVSPTFFLVGTSSCA